MLFSKPSAAPELRQHNGLEFLLKRSAKRRRTLSLRVDDAGQIVVMVPLRASLKDVHRLLDTKRDWLEAQEQKVARQASNQFMGQQGDQLWLLGQRLPLKLVTGRRHVIAAEQGELIYTYASAAPSSEMAKNKVRKWLRKQAEPLLEQKVADWAQRMQATPQGVQVKQYKARWGSCTQRDVIQLNWQLVGAPEEVIDYVVIHELAHLSHFNHSPKFWALVEQYAPDYRVLRGWLKQHGHALSVAV